MAIRFFGDSITAGVGASNIGRSWPALVETAGYSMLAVSGNTTTEQANAIYGSAIQPGDKSYYLIGTNDQRLNGENSAKLQSFKDAYAAELAWLGLSGKITGKDVAVTYTGSWSNTVAYGVGKGSTQNGAKASFQLSGPVIYISTIQQNTSGGAFKVLVDGVEKAAVSCGSAKAGYAPKLVRIAGLEDCLHTVELVVTSTTGSSNYAYFDWAAAPAFGPEVIAPTVPRMTTAAYNANGGSDWNVLQYRAAQEEIVGILAQDGLNVRSIDLWDVIDPVCDTIDGVHPNDAGQYKAARKIKG